MRFWGIYRSFTGEPNHMNLQLLYQSPLFASLPDHEIRDFARSLRQLDLAPGTLLIHEGETGDHFYFILTGELEMSKRWAHRMSA